MKRNFCELKSVRYYWWEAFNNIAGQPPDLARDVLLGRTPSELSPEFREQS
jgi:hypothetical protein